MSALAELYGTDLHKVDELVAEPICGVDFCDSCGDCLVCYAGDQCYGNSVGEHFWVVYADRVEAWRAQHPETTS